MSAYELGKKLPPLETLAAMAELYDISYDYLLGKSERIDEQANLEKNIAVLLLSGKVQDILTENERLKKIIKNISAICNSPLLSHEDKNEIVESYVQNLRE